MERTFGRMVCLLALVLLLTGCASLGIRPSEPEFTIRDENDPTITTTACAEFVDYANYSQKLQEAYLSRASQNRFWIYASGTTALATIATTAGLAAASSPSAGTLAVVSLGGGFLSGIFAVADNSTLADIYTIATGNIARSLQDADALLVVNKTTGSRFSDQEACASALKTLRAGVTQARKDLERARTDSAVAALQRAAAQTKQLNDLAVKVLADQAAAKATQNGAITSIEPDTVSIGTPTDITLTAIGVTASLCSENIRVVVGDKTIQNDKCTVLDSRLGILAVRFKPPADPPFTKQSEYSPALIIGTGEANRVEAKSGVVLKYKTK